MDEQQGLQPGFQPGYQPGLEAGPQPGRQPGPASGQVMGEPIGELPGEPVAQSTGRTTVTETAVAKIVAVAARGVPGVFALGSGPGRALGVLRDAVGGGDLTQGVHVEVGETQAAVDISLVAVYGTPLQQIAAQVRAAVYTAVKRLTGLTVIEVNVEVTDVHVPDVLEPRAGEKILPRTGAHQIAE